MSYWVNVYKPNNTATVHREDVGNDPRYIHCRPHYRAITEGGWLRFDRVPQSILINGVQMRIQPCGTCEPY